MLLPAVRHEVSFWHGGCRLVGDLVLPGAGTQHPVVLTVPGPEVTERDHSVWLDGLAEAGIAAFTWDRPAADETCPPGRSGSGPEVDAVRRAAHHAREVLAAVERLRCVPELDPDAVALVGWGEGGWAAAQAATFAADVRALILAGTPSLPPARMVEHRLIEQLKAAGHPGQDVDVAREVVRRRLGAASAGCTPAELDAVDVRHREQPWYRALAAIEEFSRPSAAALAADPAPTLSAVQAPVLALFGELDPTLPVEESAVAVRSTLRAAGHGDHAVAVVRGADRALRLRPAHGLGALVDGHHRFGEWSPALTAVLVEWLDGRLRPRRDLPAFAPPPAVGERGGPLRPADVAPPAPAVRGHRHLPQLPPLLPVRQQRRRISH